MNELECECVYDKLGTQVYQCAYCYYESEDKCSCKEDYIDLNCRECY